MKKSLETILKYCQDRKKSFDSPMFYQNDEYYLICNAKSDILEDIIYEIEKELARE